MKSPQFVYCKGFMSFIFSQVESRDAVHHQAIQFRRSFFARGLPDYSSKKFQFVNSGFSKNIDHNSLLYGFVMYFNAPTINDEKKERSFINSIIGFCEFYEIFVYFFDPTHRVDGHPQMLDDAGALALMNLSKLKQLK